MNARIRVDAFADRGAERTRRRRRAPARPDQLLQLGHQGLHDPDQDRQAARRPPPRHDRRGRDPRRPQGKRPQRAGAGDPRIRRQGPRRRPQAADGYERRGSRARRHQRQVRRGHQGRHRRAWSSRSNPIVLLTDEEKREAFGAGRSGSKKAWGDGPAGRSRQGRAAAHGRSRRQAGRPRQGEGQRQGQAQGRRRRQSPCSPR